MTKIQKMLKETETDNINNKEEIINWREECIKGNLMPGILLLEQNKLLVNDIVNEENGNTLLHYAANFGFYNVIRTLIENFKADVNIQNKYGFTPLFLVVSNTSTNIFNFQYFIKTKNDENRKQNPGNRRFKNERIFT